MNPFQKLYDKCNTGTGASQLENLPEFPTHIDLELTNACNFRCLMCPTGNLSMTRKTGFMSLEVYDAIIRECADHGTALRFIGWGEPLMHPHVLLMVQKAKEAGLKVHINTNGSHLDRRKMALLCDYGLDSMKFSFQGVDRKSYAEMRNIEFFGELMRVMEMAHGIRGGREAPYLHVSTSVTYETRGQVRKFVEKAKRFADQVSVGRTTFDFFDEDAARLPDDQLALLKDLKSRQTVEKKHPSPCPEVYQKLSIHWDGSGHVCCNDFDNHTDLGSVPDTSIASMWRHGVIQSYRETLAKGEYTGPLCSVCFDYAGLTNG